MLHQLFRADCWLFPFEKGEENSDTNFNKQFLPALVPLISDTGHRIRNRLKFLEIPRLYDFMMSLCEGIRRNQNPK